METKVLIALITGEYVRRADFLPSFIGLQRPTDSVTSTVHGCSPANGRNEIIKQALDNNCTHIFFMDDDMMFPPDTLVKLMKHEKDIVTALYLGRAFPHRPNFFDVALEDGYCKYFNLIDAKGLVKGVNCGFGAVLISTEVFKKLEPPYVRLGEIVSDGWCDDIGFFNRARKAGFDVYCDFDAPVGHMGNVIIWPEFHDGKWMTCYKHQNGNIIMEQNIASEEESNKELSLHTAK